MKRLAILTAILLIVPIAAMARMSSLSDNAMGVVSGQTGISLTWETQLQDSYISIYDDDGFGTTLEGYRNPGAVTLSSFTITGTTPGTNMQITNLTTDAGRDASNNAYLRIGMPQVLGLIRAGAVKIGTNNNMGDSLGALTFGDIDVAPTKMLIFTHTNP